MRGRRSILRRVAVAATVTAAALAATAGSAIAQSPGFGLESLETDSSSTLAGSPTNVSTTFMLNRLPSGEPAGNLRSVVIEMPRGLIGNPTGIPYCPQEVFSDFMQFCPAESQVGEATIYTFTSGVEVPLPASINNLEPSPGEPARLGMKLTIFPGINFPIQTIRFRVRTGEDYGLTAVSEGVADPFPIYGIGLEIWGVPADENPANDGTWERRAFMTAPTDCETVPETTVRVRSYEEPDRWHAMTSREDHAPEGCESLPFNPEISVRPHARTAGAPAAVDVDLLVPQPSGPDDRATAHLRDVVMTMPEGLSINPGTARDLSACSDAAFGASDPGAAACPVGSKIGNVGITTPLLGEPMSGDIFLGEPLPGERFRLFLYAEGSGVRVKIPGVVRPNPQTGRLTAIFQNNPQLPFNRMHLRFRGGTQSVLALPTTCGPKSTRASMTSWGGHSAEPESTFQVYANEEGAPCPDEQPFRASFVAGTTIPTAGGDTGLSLTFGRGDQDEFIGGLRLELPTGLLGRLSSFPLCPVARAEANQCSDDSLVGGVAVSAGVGDALLNLPGKVYLTEPPKPGHIAGLAIVVRAIAGPYDLGTVVVKNGIRVNPDTSLSVETDPIPTMLEGIPLRLRQIQVNVDRPGFMFNPTDCSPKTITGTVLSNKGKEAPVGSRFQVRGCADLPFAPPMTISATAPAAGNTMGLEVNLGGIPGHANARQVQVVLPAGIGARLDGPIQTQCSEEQFASDSCPAASRVGNAEAVTPILPSSLKGDVFFVDNGKGGGLPRLGVRLKGLVQLDLVADVEVTRGGRIATTFPAVPDVPISNFRLSLDSGAQSVLTGGNVCGRKLLAERNMIAHNGRATNDRVPVTVNGCPANAASKGSAKKSAKKKGAKRKARQQRGA